MHRQGFDLCLKRVGSLPGGPSPLQGNSKKIQVVVVQGVERGTATRVRVLKRPIAGKTGTTNKTRDAWFVGFTPSLVTGVWVGMDDERSLGPKETGSQAAAPIFIAYMREALKNQPVEHFREAAPTVLAGGRDAAGRDE